MLQRNTSFKQNVLSSILSKTKLICLPKCRSFAVFFKIFCFSFILFSIFLFSIFMTFFIFLKYFVTLLKLLDYYFFFSFYVHRWIFHQLAKIYSKVCHGYYPDNFYILIACWADFYWFIPRLPGVSMRLLFVCFYFCLLGCLLLFVCLFQYHLITPRNMLHDGVEINYLFLSLKTHFFQYIKRWRKYLVKITYHLKNY